MALKKKKLKEKRLVVEQDKYHPKAATDDSMVYRTLDAKPGKDSIIKPGELVDLIEVTPLTLSDRRIYNILLENAWDQIDRPRTHVILKRSLRGTHKDNDRVGQSIERLMSAIVKVKVYQNGEEAIERIQLLGGNVELVRDDGMFYYEIPPALRRIIKDSTVFARLKRRVMFALSSKYALTLYEMVQKRGNLSYRTHERFSIDRLRAILGVSEGKLTTWSNLKLRAIDPAIREVSEFSDFEVSISPLKTGRRVTHVDLKWKKTKSLHFFDEDKGDKPQAGSQAESQAESFWQGQENNERKDDNNKPDALLDNKKSLQKGESRKKKQQPKPKMKLRAETLDTARLRYPGFDIYYVEEEWQKWAADKEVPRDPDRAFLAFFKRFSEENPV